MNGHLMPATGFLLPLRNKIQDTELMKIKTQSITTQ
jgi:hypothetical protein